MAMSVSNEGEGSSSRSQSVMSMTRGKQRLVMAEGVGLPAEAAHVSFDLSRTPTETDEEDEEDEEVEDNELDYEARRQQRILDNQLLLNSLGISTFSHSVSVTLTTQAAGPSSPSGRKKPKKSAIYDRSGYILSLPQGDEVHRMAAVEIPSDRALKGSIARGEYEECSDWLEGEERRWRFGRGKGGSLGPDEPEEVGGVGVGFRWKRWGGLRRELKREMRKRNELNEADQNFTGTGEVSAYSLIPGDPCHQCRRKSEKAKMRCRNVDPLCRASFCETCCRRYSYFEFDAESRSFICPLCKDCCNCANCIRKRNLAHLLGPGRQGARPPPSKANGKMTVQEYLDKAIEGNVGLPFDRVRLVDQSMDVVTPPLPQELQALVMGVQQAPTVASRKRGGGSGRPFRDPGKRGEEGGKGTGQKGQGARTAKRAKLQLEEVDVEDEGTRRSSLVLKFKMPKKEHRRRVKEVDSDGDTIPGSSDEEGDSGHSDLTPLSDRTPEQPIARRLPFPARPFDLQDTQPATLAEVDTALSENHAGQKETVVAKNAHVSNDATPASLPAESTSSSSSPPGGGRGGKKRKPPPKANIIRAPRHAGSFPLPEAQSHANLAPNDRKTTTKRVSAPATSDGDLTQPTLDPTPPPPSPVESQTPSPIHPLPLWKRETSLVIPQGPHQTLMGSASRSTSIQSVPFAHSSIPPMFPHRIADSLDLLCIAAAEARQSPSFDDAKLNGMKGGIWASKVAWSAGMGGHDLTMGREMLVARRYPSDLN